MRFPRNRTFQKGLLPCPSRAKTPGHALSAERKGGLKATAASTWVSYKEGWGGILLIQVVLTCGLSLALLVKPPQVGTSACLPYRGAPPTSQV